MLGGFLCSEIIWNEIVLISYRINNKVVYFDMQNAIALMLFI